MENNQINIKLPRLADFAQFTIHMERANGWPEGETIRAMQENYSGALTAIAEDSPLTDILVNFIIKQNNSAFSGSADELLTKLHNDIKDDEDKKHILKLKSWPDSASKLGTFITRNIDVLANKGLKVEKEKTRKGRILTLFTGDRPEELFDDIPF